MSITHTLTQSVSGGAVNLTGNVSASADSEVHCEVALTSSQSNAEVDVVFAFADLASFYYLCDQNSVIKTNSTSAPDDTFTVPGGKPFTWNTAMLVDNPFTADVTKLYITNSVATAATAKILVLADATP